MSDIATEIKETKAVSTPEKVVEKKPVEKNANNTEVDKVNNTEVDKVKEKEVKEDTEEEKTKENGEAPEESENGDDKEEPTTENEDSSDVSDKCAVKRKSVGGGDATDNVDGEKKAKLEEAPVENVTNGV